MRVIGFTELYLTTPNTHKRQASMFRRDSNPQSQQASGHKKGQNANTRTYLLTPLSRVLLEKLAEFS